MAKKTDTEEPKPEKRKRLKRTKRVISLVVVGGGSAFAFSESFRSKVLDKLFGAEEEFQYSPPAGAPSAEPPAENAD